MPGISQLSCSLIWLQWLSWQKSVERRQFLHQIFCWHHIGFLQRDYWRYSMHYLVFTPYTKFSVLWLLLVLSSCVHRNRRNEWKEHCFFLWLVMQPSIDLIIYARSRICLLFVHDVHNMPGVGRCQNGWESFEVSDHNYPYCADACQGGNTDHFLTSPVWRKRARVGTQSTVVVSS